jgi:hydrogenase maturation protein HypF
VPAEAAWFHVALAEALAEWAGAAAREIGARTVCLGGGCFCNAVLTEHVTAGLQRQGLKVLRPQAYTCGDAALALGQAWVAAHQLQAGGRPLFIEVNESLSCA